MTILVTGGAGFIGVNFVLDWLAASDEPVVNLDKLTYAGRRESLASLEGDKRHIFVEGDIGDLSLVTNLLSEHHVRAVINFAAETHVDRSILEMEDFIQTNVVGTSRLLEASRRYYASANEEMRLRFRFLHVSTDEVYGSLDTMDKPFTENSPYAPGSPYAASKAASNHLVRAVHNTYGLPVVTAISSNNYGPYQYPEKVIPLMIYRALSGQDLPVYGDGMQIRDWLFVGDHCRVLRMMLDKGRVGHIYNVGGSNQKRNIELVMLLCAILDELRPKKGGGSYGEQIRFVADRPGHDRRYAVDASRSEAELGWRPRETFDTGIKKTVQWYLDHADWISSVADERFREWEGLQYA